MTTARTLPARPSLAALRKQAKKLMREIAAREPDALARARSQLPNAGPPLSLRDAQFVLAREYGFSGWREMIAEVNKRLELGLEWAANEAHRAIHDNDVERLANLAAQYPGLLTWRSDEHDGGLLGMATSAFRDSFDARSEEYHTRAACAEYLIDAGAVVAPSVREGLVDSRARGLLRLFELKNLLPRTLKFLTVLGDVAGVRGRLRDEGDDLATVNEAFMCACRFEHRELGSLLLDRSTALDLNLAQRIDSGPGPSAFIESIMSAHSALAFMDTAPAGPWQVFQMHEVAQALHDDELETFSRLLRREPWFLGEARIGFQVELIERATLQGRGAFIDALLDLEPALLRRHPPPRSQAFEHAFTYAKTDLIPLLIRIWPLPEDLPHAAGMGDLDRVRSWFDDEGKPALAGLTHHFPANSVSTRRNLQWGEATVQHVLDTALAWAVINNNFEVADYLLEHGADINTRWGSHEPASILHELVFHKNYEAMQFLIDRGIDMTITDYRWGGTARGWAHHAAKDQRMAEWLAAAERSRESELP